MPVSIFASDPTDAERLYRRLIDEAARDRKNKIIRNGKPAHAVYLLHTLLANAGESIKLLTRNLARTADPDEEDSDQPIYVYQDPQITKDARTFFQTPGAVMEIIIASDPDLEEGDDLADHPFIKAVLPVAGDRLKVFRMVDVEAAKEEFSFLGNDFIVMDRRAFRLETDTTNKTAFINFGVAKMAEDLAKFFDIVKDHQRLCRPVPIVAT